MLGVIEKTRMKSMQISTFLRAGFDGPGASGSGLGFDHGAGQPFGVAAITGASTLGREPVEGGALPMIGTDDGMRRGGWSGPTTLRTLGHGHMNT